MKKVTLTLLLGSFLFSCTEKPSKETKDETLLSENEFFAVPMPAKLITGNSFPTDSSRINSWVSQSTEKDNIETNEDIINHGWAIWSALTDMTDQVSNGQTLRRFETWYTPEDIIGANNLQRNNGEAKLKHISRNTGTPSAPNQFHGNTTDADVVSFVKYDPNAAEHAFDNKLFYESTLSSLLVDGQINKVPDFPSSSITLKPVFAPLTEVDPSTGNYIISVWPGNDGNPNRAFGPSQWNNTVQVTISGNTDVDKHIYSIKDFINFKLDSAQAKKVGGKTGDYAVLQGMHVTTREITRWTWQTFWWSETNDQPFSPSSSTIASLRPSDSLDSGADHYAMAICYNMVTPSQPYYGGSGENASSLYAYNPYLEAGFDTTQFTRGNDSVRIYYPASYQEVGGSYNAYGMQSNCMSCHSQARYMQGFSNSDHLYLSDQYVDMAAPYYKNAVKLDFAWSILGSMVSDQ